MSWLSRMRPWPAKRERRANIQAAREEHAASRDRAAKSRVVRQQITRLAEANHYVQKIEDQIIHGHE